MFGWRTPNKQLPTVNWGEGTMSSLQTLFGNEGQKYQMRRSEVLLDTCRKEVLRRWRLRWSKRRWNWRRQSKRGCKMKNKIQGWLVRRLRTCRHTGANVNSTGRKYERRGTEEINGRKRNKLFVPSSLCPLRVSWLYIGRDQNFSAQIRRINLDGQSTD